MVELFLLIREKVEEFLKKNEVNWSILLASGKEIKRDSISSVNENRYRLKVKWIHLFEYRGTFL